MSLLVKTHSRGVRDLLRGGEIQSYLLKLGRGIARDAGNGFEVEGEVGRNRARVAVYTATFEAMRAEARNRVLTRAVGNRAGR